ncbi:hypothetical protein KJ660_02200, partial [Candidatus Micrarchaeota archaeon]|nr:hypothetical protein [Candidatus Micrarchaeota archaeon]
ELSKMIESELAAKKMEIDKFISLKAEESAGKVQQEITGKIGADVEAHVKDSIKDLDTFKDLSLSKQNEFQSRMERTISGMGQLVEKSRKKIEETADKVDMFELDITEAKLKGFAVKNRRMRDTLFVLGIIFSTLSFYLIFSFLNSAAGIEQVIAIISSGLIAAALLYAGSII